jgi:hypothetical protein
MGLDVEGDDAVADGIRSRLDILSAREVLLSALRQETGPLQLKREQSKREARSASPAALRLLPNENDGSSSGSRFVPTATDPVPSILRCAETLAIPWKQIVVDEIEAEQVLRRFIADVENECPLRSALKLLPSSFLRSWRIRKQIESLSLAARSASIRDAIRQLRDVFSELVGRNENEKAAFALHLWFAYQRILLLQRVRRAASRSRGILSERLASICSAARCSYDDAAWALLEEESPRRGNRLDAAVRKVQEEGFRIPQAKTEARSFAQLRRIVRASAHLSGRRQSRGILADPALALTSTRRVPVPPDAL